MRNRFSVAKAKPVQMRKIPSKGSAVEVMREGGGSLFAGRMRTVCAGKSVESAGTEIEKTAAKFVFKASGCSGT